ncbi:MAG: amidohydrolase family protein [Burkholderiales bacterium]|nr:amidohydrolase family protein [Burkholderiales bacterium]
MAHDLLIRNGTVVDGTGAPARRCDVAIRDGRIAALGGDLGEAAEVIDAAGRVVAPGFVDIHTHYDAQICWDPDVAPSSWHGVTTVVMGNCGVGIAPCRAQAREVATQDLVNVESIPYDVLRAGIAWEWETFPQYMDAAARRGSAINLGFFAPLTPLRHFVMGEASMERAASPEETREIAALLGEALEAGAFGFSTSILKQHMGYGGRPLACQRASREELAAYARRLGAAGKGIVEIALCQKPSVISDDEYRMLEFLLDESGRPVSWLSVFVRDDLPEAHVETLRKTAPLARRGAVPQISAVPFTREISLRSPFTFASYPSWHRVFNKDKDEQARIYADRGFRDAFRAELGGPAVFNGDWRRITLASVADPLLKRLEGRTVAEIAAERGCDGVDAFLDVALEDDLGAEFQFAAYNFNDARMPELLTDMDTVIALSDGGAHVDLMCDAAYPSHLLGKWVRDKGALSLELAVHRLTAQPADLVGLKDRGRLAPGHWADVVIFDPATVGPGRREKLSDLPAGGKRIVVHSTGIERTIVNGCTVFAHGRLTGERPGRVLRS